MYLTATVFHEVAGMVDESGRQHLIEELKLSLVPERGDGAPHHRFVGLPAPGDAGLHGAHPLTQEAPFQPPPDEPVALSQRRTERALSGCLFGAQFITTVHIHALLCPSRVVWSREKGSMSQGATKRCTCHQTREGCQTLDKSSRAYYIFFSTLLR